MGRRKAKAEVVAGEVHDESLVEDGTDVLTDDLAPRAYSLSREGSHPLRDAARSRPPSAALIIRPPS